MALFARTLATEYSPREVSLQRSARSDCDLVSGVSGCEMLVQLWERESDAKQCNSSGNIDICLDHWEDCELLYATGCVDAAAFAVMAFC